MKKRFGAPAGRGGIRNILIYAFVMVVALCMFWIGMDRASTQTLEREQEALSDALQRSITHCYAIEGVYPESLDYLVENYGITYDSDKFIVDYVPYGSDIMPDVTIIAKGGADE